MNITPSLIYYLLSEDFKITVIRESKAQTVVNFPVIFYSEKPELLSLYPCALFICNNQSDAETVLASNRAALVIGSVDAALSVKGPLAYIDEDIEISYLLTKVFSLMQNLQTWDCMMKDACDKDIDLNQVFKLCQEIYPREFALVSSSYEYLAVSSQYFNAATYMKPEPNSNRMPLEEINNLLLDNEFLEVDSFRGVRTYPSNPAETRTIYYNFFHEDIYQARLLASLEPFAKKGYRILEGEKQLFAHVAAYVEKVFSRNRDKELSDVQQNPLHSRMKSLLTKDKEVSSQHCVEEIGNYGWLDSHSYQVFSIRMFNTKEFELSAPYLAHRLETQHLGTIAVVIENELVWIINRSVNTRIKDEEITETIKAYLGDFACKAGASTIQRGLYALSLLYNQCTEAFRLGEYRDPHFWRYNFEDYANDYLLGNAIHHFPPESLYHEGLKALISHDKKQGTQYVAYLIVFLSHNMNVTSAAEELYVHRTTLTRQLNKITDISGISLSGKSDLFELEHLLFSLALYMKDLEDSDDIAKF